MLDSSIFGAEHAHEAASSCICVDGFRSCLYSVLDVSTTATSDIYCLLVWVIDTSVESMEYRCDIFQDTSCIFHVS